MPVVSCIPFSFPTPCDAMLIMLVHATHWLSLHLYTLAYMSMHDSYFLVCRPYFNTMKLWTSDPNLHLSLAETTFCLFVCLLAFSFICASCLPYLLSHSMLAMSIMFIRFMPFHMLFASFPSLACVLVSCLCLCIYTHGARTCGARAQSPRHKQRGRDRKHVDISQVAAVSRFRSLAFFPLVMYSFKKPLLPLLFLP